MKSNKMNRELTDEDRRRVDRAQDKGYAIAALKLATTTLRAEGFEALATALDLLVVAVRNADDPKQITADEKTRGVFD